MDRVAITVGALRAELVGYPDETPVVVIIEDPRLRGRLMWLNAAGAGHGPGLPGDEPAFSSAFVIHVAQAAD